MTGMIKGGIYAGIGVIATDIVQGFIPFSWGGAWGKIISRGASAWLVGYLAEASRLVSSADALLMSIGGISGAVQDAFRLAQGFIGSSLLPSAPAQAAIPAVAALPTTDESGISEIVVAPQGYPGLGEVAQAPYWQGAYS